MLAGFNEDGDIYARTIGASTAPIIDSYSNISGGLYAAGCLLTNSTRPPSLDSIRVDFASGALD